MSDGGAPRPTSQDHDSHRHAPNLGALGHDGLSSLDSGPMNPSAAVLVPVKSFHHAKERLAPALEADERAQLARDMATNVVRAAGPLPVVVLCDTDDVASWALGLDAEALWCPDTDLNGAVSQGISELSRRGVPRAVVAHSDLPLATSLSWIADWPSITLVPDRRRDGTNVIGVPTGCGFRFTYGPGSFARHLHDAQRLGLGYRVIRDAALAWDVDDPADLDLPDGHRLAAAVTGRATP